MSNSIDLKRRLTISLTSEKAANELLAIPGILKVNTTGNIVSTGDILPAEDNTYSLGSVDVRWKSVHVGPGSLYIQDTNNIGLNTKITVTDGVLQINGANQLLAPNLLVTGSTIFSGIGIQDGNQSPSEILDLSKSIFTFADGTWILPNGAEGQLCHFVMHSGGSAEDIYITVSQLRKIVGGQAVVQAIVSFRPFPFSGGPFVNSLTTAIFTEGAWNFSQGSLV
jgi:hypothetical protein